MSLESEEKSEDIRNDQSVHGGLKPAACWVCRAKESHLNSGKMGAIK